MESSPDGTPREEGPLQMFKQPQLRCDSPSLEEEGSLVTSRGNAGDGDTKVEVDPGRV